MIDFVNSDDELALIFGHELAHGIFQNLLGTSSSVWAARAIRALSRVKLIMLASIIQCARDIRPMALKVFGNAYQPSPLRAFILQKHIREPAAHRAAKHPWHIG